MQIGKLDKTQSYLKSIHLYLLQNRLSLTELARLNEKSKDFNGNSTYLILTVKETNNKALESLRKKPNFDKSIDELFSRTELFLKNQQQLINDLQKEESFPKKMSLLKSKHSIALLTDEGNLILAYNFWIDKLDNLKKSLRIF